MIDPRAILDMLDGCVLCHRLPIITVGYFLPATAAMHAVVLRLRQRTLVDDKAPALAYGLCRKHSRNLEHSAQRADAIILTMAERITVQ